VALTCSTVSPVDFHQDDTFVWETLCAFEQMTGVNVWPSDAGSRFCEVRYCIVRHCAFLVGYGHSSGDPTAPAQSVEQAIRLLRVPPPWQRNSDAVLDALETGPTMAGWPAPETDLEDHLFSACRAQKLHPRRFSLIG
jgi:hypothetical protein